MSYFKFKMPEALREALRDRALREGEAEAQIIRRALRAYLEQKEQS
jgi:predicted DNA-binding protein